MSLINLTTNYSQYISDDFLLFNTFFPLMVVVPIVGFPTNVFALWILLRKPGLCSTSHIFITNLAMLDALCCLLQPIEIVSAIFSPSDEQLLHTVLLNQFAGPLFQTCTCVDCYVGVLHPVMFLKFKTPMLRLGLCAVIWGGTVIFSILASNYGGTSEVLESMGGFLIVELCIMFYCNVQVLRALMQRGPGCRQVHPSKLRAQRTVLTLLIMVMVHYITPVMNFLMISYHKVSRTSLFSLVAFTIACISSCNHPFFYLLRSGKISCNCCRKS